MTVDVSGAILAEITLNTPAGYEAKTAATTLPGIFTWWADNTGAPFWLNVTASGAPAGMTVSFSGQYLHYVGPPANSFSDVGVPFDVTGYHLIDKTKCTWGGPEAGGLRITMTWSGAPLAGSYPITVKVQVGT
jgi:hypothetical protein